MSTATKIPYTRARAIADRLIGLLEPCCVRIEAAGSLRRLRPEIGDLDLVAVPRTTSDLLGNPVGSMVDDELAAWLERGTVLKGRQWGEQAKQFILLDGTKVDLICCDLDVFGAWLAVRTGPPRMSKALVADRSKGGLLPNGWIFANGFRLLDAQRNPVAVDEEAKLLDAIGVGWIAPEDRSETSVDAAIERMKAGAGVRG